LMSGEDASGGAGHDGMFVTTISEVFLLFPFGCHTDLV
jgi:hypothetical protein